MKGARDGGLNFTRLGLPRSFLKKLASFNEFVRRAVLVKMEKHTQAYGGNLRASVELKLEV